MRNPRRPKAFLCLCPSCHSGWQCQFHTKSFVFTRDQLLFTDIFFNPRATNIALVTFFSFLTLHRRPCLRHGVGHDLLWMSVIDQINLAFFVVRLIPLIIKGNERSSASVVWEDLLCKFLNSLLSSSTRMVHWSTSLIAIAHLSTTMFFNGRWLRKARIARRLIFVAFSGVFISLISVNCSFTNLSPM